MRGFVQIVIPIIVFLLASAVGGGVYFGVKYNELQKEVLESKEDAENTTQEEATIPVEPKEVVESIVEVQKVGVPKLLEEEVQNILPEENLNIGSPEESYWDKMEVVHERLDDGIASLSEALDLVKTGAIKTSGLYIQKSFKPLNEALDLLNAGYIEENRRSHLYLVTSTELLILAAEELNKNYETGQKSSHYFVAADYFDQSLYYATLSSDFDRSGN